MAVIVFQISSVMLLRDVLDTGTSAPLEVIAAALTIMASVGSVALWAYRSFGAVTGEWLIVGPTNRERRLEHRKWRKLAQHVEIQIRNLDQKASWDDLRYADLSAEIEYQRPERRVFGSLRLLRRRQLRIERADSLFEAINSTRFPRVLLQGHPGSGKSVALRQVCLRMAAKASRSRRPGRPIPVYVNLRDFGVEGRPTADDVRSFVVESLVGTAANDLRRYVMTIFEAPVAPGPLLLLFDSFDEIPAILSSTDVDSSVGAYRDAIHGYTSGLRDCRVVVASRLFNGPDALDWPAFRIAELSDRQQQLLAQLSGADEASLALITKYIARRSDGEDVLRNPMFLSLLCDFVINERVAPKSVHEVYDSFLERQICTHGPDALLAFGLDQEDVKRIAGQVAFVVNARREGGSSDRPEQVRRSRGLVFEIADIESEMAELGMRPDKDIHAGIDALVRTRIIRPAGTAPAPGRPERFEFSHRRLQEYFATTVVLGQRDLVPVDDLLRLGQWRETAVTILQTRPPAGPEVQEILVSAAQEIRAAADYLAPQLSNPRVDWPPGVLHLAGLLAAGLGDDPAGRPKELEVGAEETAVNVYGRGSLIDRKWALDLVGMMGMCRRRDLIDHALTSDSRYLRDAAIWKVGSVHNGYSTYRRELGQWLAGRFQRGELSSDSGTIKVQLARIDGSRNLARLVDVMAAGPILHLLTWMTLTLTFLRLGDFDLREELLGTVCLSCVALVSYLTARLRTSRVALWPAETVLPWLRLGISVINPMVGLGFLFGTGSISNWHAFFGKPVSMVMLLVWSAAFFFAATWLVALTSAINLAGPRSIASVVAPQLVVLARIFWWSLRWAAAGVSGTLAELDDEAQASGQAAWFGRQRRIAGRLGLRSALAFGWLLLAFAALGLCWVVLVGVVEGATLLLDALSIDPNLDFLGPIFSGVIGIGAIALLCGLSWRALVEVRHRLGMVRALRRRRRSSEQVVSTAAEFKELFNRHPSGWARFRLVDSLAYASIEPKELKEIYDQLRDVLPDPDVQTDEVDRYALAIWDRFSPAAEPIVRTVFERGATEVESETARQ